MSQIPMIMLPKGNFHGRRIFVELKPTDNADMVALELDAIINSVVADKLTEAKSRENFHPKIIQA